MDKPGNERLVSLATMLLEGILRDKIYQHLHRHRLIRGSQHGFGMGNHIPQN